MSYRIKEVSQRTGVLTHTLRYWEKEFNGLLTPSRSRGKHRFYTDEDIDRVVLIRRLLKDEGYSIQGAKKALESKLGEDGANGHLSANGNGQANGNGHAAASGTGLPEQLVDRIAAAVATRLADLLKEPSAQAEPESKGTGPGLFSSAEAVAAK